MCVALPQLNNLWCMRGTRFVKLWTSCLSTA